MIGDFNLRIHEFRANSYSENKQNHASDSLKIVLQKEMTLDHVEMT
jgi:hypothetical protein